MPIASLQCQLQVFLSKQVKRYVEGWRVCDDAACKTRTKTNSVFGSMDPMKESNIHPGCITRKVWISDEFAYTKDKTSVRASWAARIEYTFCTKAFPCHWVWRRHNVRRMKYPFECQSWHCPMKRLVCYQHEIVHLKKSCVWIQILGNSIRVGWWQLRRRRRRRKWLIPKRGHFSHKKS